MEFRKYLVMISHLEGTSNGRRPNQVASPRSSRSTPMLVPTVIKRDMPRKNKMYTPKIQRSRYAQNLQQVSSQLQIPDSIQAMNDQMTIYVTGISST